jgi:glycosidase
MNMLKKFISAGWVHSTNIYEVNLRQYTPEGTFNAFAGHFPRLRDMGVHTLWFMPVQPIGIEKRKGSLGSYYSISDYNSINPEFGNADDFKKLVAEAHQFGFKIIIDWVANHTSWDHVWTKTHPDFFSKDEAGGFRPPFPDWEDVIDLNYECKSLWSAMIECMKYWISEFDIDGFRCDMASLVPLEFWKQSRKELDAIKPLFWFGEFDELNDPEYGEAFDASYTWTWMHKTENFLKQQEPLNLLYSVLKNYDDLGDGTMRTWFTSNHDENSWNGTEYEKYGDMAKALAVFSCTWNGIPLTYSGQELPNRMRLKFFDKDAIRWTGHNDMHEFYKTLLNLHSNNPALRGGDPAVQTFRIKTTDSKHVFAYLRVKGKKEVLVLLNLSPQNDLFINILDEMITGVYKNVFSEAVNDLTKEKNFILQAWEYFVYEK